MNELQTAQRKVVVLHHICRELTGVINEFRAMPCPSLETRMFGTVDRYAKRIRDNAPDVVYPEIAETEKEKLEGALAELVGKNERGEVTDLSIEIMNIIKEFFHGN